MYNELKQTVMKAIDWEAINREWEIDELIRRNHSYLYPVEIEDDNEINCDAKFERLDVSIKEMYRIINIINKAL
jgi:hypothetical protein